MSFFRPVAGQQVGNQRMTKPTSGNVWFITGCSSGFGRELAVRAIDQGHRVVATARNRQSLDELQAKHPDSVLALQMDVTDTQACARAIGEAEGHFGQVDVLVNNAGYGYYAAIEEGEVAAVRTLFDTHFFGLVGLTKLVLPGMRARRSGRIVNFSSIGGLIGFPGTGYYCAAKFAIEGLSEALSKEVEPLGIRVMIVEPGPFQTNFIGGSRKESRIEIPDYASTAGLYRHAATDRKLPGDPARAARLIVEAVDGPETPLRLLLGRSAYSRVIDKLTGMIAEFNLGRDRSFSADFPLEDAGA